MKKSQQVALSLVAAVCLILAACGGSGGGGGSAGGSAPVPDVMIGTIAFNPLSSQNLIAHPFAFPIGNAWTWSETRVTGGVPITSSTVITQSFSLTTITVGTTSLPCYLVHYSFSLINSYSIWATAKNGGLYNLTNVRVGQISEASIDFLNPPPVAAQPLLVLPPSPNVANSWVSGCTGYAIGYDSGQFGKTRTIMSMNATSPAGFTNCMQIQITNPLTPSSYDPVYEYWKPGYGVVETVSSDPAEVDNRRTGIAFSG